MFKLFVIYLSAVTVRGSDQNFNLKQDWWETAVIYQIYVRSFMDSDGDGIGDIAGVTSRLDHLKEIGADAAWLSPIFKSPMNDFGFDVADYYTIEPHYGTIEDFDQLLKKASELNIKIILDFVPNHTSNESEWFIKSSNRDEYYNDWYIWANGHIDCDGNKLPPNNWISLFGNSSWSYMPNRDQFYLHQFGKAQPDLNFRSPVVVDEIKSIIKFWLETGVAGMRINAVNLIFETDKDNFGGTYPDEPKSGNLHSSSNSYNYLDHIYTKDQDETYELVSQFREVFDAISIRDNLTRVMMTDACTNIKNAVKYYGEGVQSGAHVPFNFALIEVLDKGSDWDARDIKYAIDRWMTYKPLMKQANWMIGNQDKSRLASRVRPDLVDAFNMLVLLLPGVAITYMGEEIGMINGAVPWSNTKDPLACNTDDPVKYIEVSRDPARTPFQWSSGKNAGFSTAHKTWLPVANGYKNINVDSQRSAARSHYKVYRTLTKLRSRTAFREGRYESHALHPDVFAFKRWYKHDTYIVVMNFGKTYRIVNLTAFDLIFGQLEVEASSVLSSRTYSDNVPSDYLDLAADEALVLRMQV
ncbi:hypothetical protein ACJJTC_011915 [Scirpophaga incertulas]